MNDAEAVGPLHLFSQTHMPSAGPERGEALWHGMDTPKRQAREPHPILGPQDIRYRFNSLGYRCPEFSLPLAHGTLRLVSIGASEVMGTGLPEASVFGSVFGAAVERDTGRPVHHWNLGKGGASPDYVSRVLYSALHVLQPDFVLLNFPAPGRREHIDDTGRVIDFSTGAKALKKSKVGFLKLGLAADPLRAEVLRAEETLSNDHSDLINLFKNYQFCTSLCASFKVMWLCTSNQRAYLEGIQALIDPRHLVQPGVGDLRISSTEAPGLRWARDMRHPGIGPHKALAALLFERLKALYPDRLQALRQAEHA
jgi:hypothetical protein